MAQTYTVNTWLEAPCRYDMYNIIRKFCINNKITIHKLEAVPCAKDWVDKVFCINRETIYIHISGERESLNKLQNWLEKTANQINSEL